MAKGYYSKKEKLFDITRIDASYPSTDVPIKVAVEMDNIMCADGFLTSGECESFMKDKYGTFIGVPPDICSRIFYHQVQSKKYLIAYGNGVCTYYCSLDKYIGWSILVNRGVYGIVPVASEGIGMLLMATTTTLILTDIESVRTLTDTGVELIKLDSFTRHFGRMFAVSVVNKNRLYFSDETNPLDWRPALDKGGWIQFDQSYGDLLAVISFNDYIYIFAEKAIYRLTAYGVQTEFVLKKLDLIVDTIIPKTINVCNGMMIFATTIGLMGFDGYSVKLIHEGLKFDTHMTTINSTVCQTKYYLSIQTQIYIFDIAKHNYIVNNYNYNVGVVKGEMARGIVKVNDDTDRDGVIVSTRVGGSNAGEYFTFYNSNRSEMGRIGHIKTGELDFGNPNAVKVLKTLFVSSEISGSITIQCDGVSHRFALNNIDKVNLNISGKIIVIDFKIYDACVKIKSPILEYEVKS